MRNFAITNWAIPALVVGLGAVLLSVSGCKIVPNDQRASVAGASTNAGQGASTSAFDAPAYVDTVWDKDLVPFFTSKSTDLPVVVKEIAADFATDPGSERITIDADGVWAWWPEYADEYADPRGERYEWDADGRCALGANGWIWLEADEEE